MWYKEWLSWQFRSSLWQTWEVRVLGVWHKSQRLPPPLGISVSSLQMWQWTSLVLMDWPPVWRILITNPPTRRGTSCVRYTGSVVYTSLVPFIPSLDSKLVTCSVTTTPAQLPRILAHWADSIVRLPYWLVTVVTKSCCHRNRLHPMMSSMPLAQYQGWCRIALLINLSFDSFYKQCPFFSQSVKPFTAMGSTCFRWSKFCSV